MTPSSAAKDSEDEPVVGVGDGAVVESSRVSERLDEEGLVERADHQMMEDSSEHSSPATVFSIRLKQPPSNLRHKMSVPELCRTFRRIGIVQLGFVLIIEVLGFGSWSDLCAATWCLKLNAIACASETCARIPSSTAQPPFWIPIHIVNPERPTECSVFTVTADSPRDSVQFIEWSPASCPRALLIANFHGRITIWSQPSKGPANLVRDSTCWECEHQWHQDIAVVTKWLCGMSPYRWLSSNSSSSGNSKTTFEEKFLSQPPQTSGRWPNFLCVCSVFSSGSVQLHWSQWPLAQRGAVSKWYSTSKGLLGAGPSGIMAADAIITDTGAMHVAGVPIVNPSTVVVWEVSPGPGNGFQATAKRSTSNGVPLSLDPPHWSGFAPLAAYLFSWQEYLGGEGNQGKKQMEQDCNEGVSLHCSPVSNFSAYVSPEAAAQSAATTTWGSGVTAVAFDPTRGGSVISVVIVEGLRFDEFVLGKSVKEAESGSNPSDDISDMRHDKVKRFSFDPLDLPSDIRALARIVYSAHGGEVAVAFLHGVVQIFSGPGFAPVDNYQVNVNSAIAAPTFSSTGCCLACVWHDTDKDRSILKIIRVLPPAVPSSQVKVNSATWERAIADRFWWSLLVGVDWWDAVGCTQSAAEDGIVLLTSVIAVLDADFHSLPSTQHRQQYGPIQSFGSCQVSSFSLASIVVEMKAFGVLQSLDRIKCRLLEGTNAQEVRALVLDMQARLLLDMLGKGIESALINPSTLVPEPWQASGETISGIDSDLMTVEPALISSIQAYVDSVLDLASHFITRLRRYASFCRTLASHAVGATANTGGNRNMVTSPTHSSASPSANQSQQHASLGGQSGTSSTTGSSQMQAWVQGAIAKISSTADGVSNSTPNPISGPSPFMPISINTGTFPGTPAVRLIGDCHFLHRLCQLLLFCLFFRRRQMPRYIGGAQRNPDQSIQKPQPNSSAKVEEVNSASARPTPGMNRPDDVQAARAGQTVPGVKGVEEGPASRTLRLGTGNAGHGYTCDEVRVLFLILVDLCRRTASLPHPLPASQVGGSNIQIRLHYIDGNYTVLPENMPRPRGADAAGLLLRELELHPPAEEWHRRNMFGGPWSDTEDLAPLDDNPKLSSYSDLLEFDSSEDYDSYYGPQGLWPRNVDSLREMRLSAQLVQLRRTSARHGGLAAGLMAARYVEEHGFALFRFDLQPITVWSGAVRCAASGFLIEDTGHTLWRYTTSH
ncbi:hypothetical protein Syun_008388 [Stephania yunnanensis]|uniref:Mediator of RNA polymerase II transcription subunit 16 n=1 Tax=Stephania yunnanensis TaxID=152371 RepID=A0AAP0KEG3_9MAGN